MTCRNRRTVPGNRQSRTLYKSGRAIISELVQGRDIDMTAY